MTFEEMSRDEQIDERQRAYELAVDQLHDLVMAILYDRDFAYVGGLAAAADATVGRIRRLTGLIRSEQVTS